MVTIRNRRPRKTVKVCGRYLACTRVQKAAGKGGTLDITEEQLASSTVQRLLALKRIEIVGRSGTAVTPPRDEPPAPAAASEEPTPVEEEPAPEPPVDPEPEPEPEPAPAPEPSPPPKQWTRDELEGKTLPELRPLYTRLTDASPSGLRKADIIDGIIGAQEA